MMTVIFCIAAAYLLGSISSAIVASKLCGFADPRSAGSQNAGATNVLRLGGKKIALLVLVADALKGVVAVIIAQLLGLEMLGLGLVALFAILGHVFPVFHGFKGGKGIATAIGCYFALSLWMGLIIALIWLAAAKIWRYSSLSSILTAVSAPIVALFMDLMGLLPALVAITLLIIFKHWANIERLMRGTEPKIGEKANADKP